MPASRAPDEAPLPDKRLNAVTRRRPDSHDPDVRRSLMLWAFSRCRARDRNHWSGPDCPRHTTTRDTAGHRDEHQGAATTPMPTDQRFFALPV